MTRLDLFFFIANRRDLKRFALYMLFLVASGTAANSQEREKPRNETATEHSFSRIAGVPYSDGKHGPLLADLFLPANKALHPAVIFLHGGAWRIGDRTQLQDVAVSLADEGYVGMAIDYDMTDKGDRFPVPLEEGEQAVAWLRKNAEKYQVDPRRIAVAGSSAGGELAALIALDRRPILGADVQAAIIFNGVLDLSDIGPDPENMVAPYLGGSCAAKFELCKRASPVFQVHGGAPPFFVGHGTADRVVPYSQAEHFVNLLRGEHVQVTPFVAKDAGHTYWNTNVWFKANIEAVLAFLHAAMPSREF